MAPGQPRANALRDAQLASIKAHRRKKKATHFFWSAFTLTGRWW